MCKTIPFVQKQKIETLRLGIEPRSTAICLDRGCLVTGGYTDHYTNEELVDVYIAISKQYKDALKTQRSLRSSND